MQLLGHYLHEFNRDYLSTRADRREAGKTLADAAAMAALFIIAAVIMWGLS